MFHEGDSVTNTYYKKTNGQKMEATINIKDATKPGNTLWFVTN